ncbi:hypothetical protein N0B16_05695 [Chryseobacterium sp. GMJ5]|uniref:ABC transporter permease n=1 Tax=Chryseobacterium gilvum TaxID=2976534 RepID=A0ABT2VXW1_9FLAO|nr:hypothetical protein [Chryseobacterium gilvum]MCU7613924.1 hypothetical protein [Chryseobacterium gilvum]
MKEVLSLSFLYAKYHIKKKNFLIYIIILLILGFLLIPNEKAAYVTFYIGNISVYPNTFWIGNMGAVFSNIIISVVLFFVILGERQQEMISNRYCFEETSVFGFFLKNRYKIIALFFISILFLFILNASLIASNYTYGINIIAYLQSLVYFSVPFLFFISFWVYFLEFYLVRKTYKILLFFITFLVILFNDRFFNITGLNELYLYIRKIADTQNYFAIGYLKKANRIKVLTLQSYNPPLFLHIKVIWILMTCALIYAASRIKNYGSYLVFDQTVENISAKMVASKKMATRFLEHAVPLQLSFMTLIRKDVMQLSKAYTQKRIALLVFLWLILFVTPMESVQKFVLPALMVIIVYLNRDFISKLYSHDLGYCVALSPFRKEQLYMSQITVIFLLYFWAVIPYLIKLNSISGLLVIINILLMSILQVLSIHGMKKSLLVNIVLIILFTSYMTGKPILNILNF